MVRRIMAVSTGGPRSPNLKVTRIIPPLHVRVLDVENLAVTSCKIHWRLLLAIIDFRERNLLSLRLLHPYFDVKQI